MSAKRPDALPNRAGSENLEKVRVRVRGKVTHGRIKESVVYEKERQILHVILLSDGSQFIVKEKMY